jgi:hypothetical protein
MAYAEPEAVTEKDLDRLNPDLDTDDRPTRAEAAVALRIAGATYSEIARTLGYSNITRARQAVEQALASSVGDDDRERMRFIEGRRLERLLRGLWHKATDEENEEQLAAARTALAVIDRHAKLYGLDAPTVHAIYSPTQTEMEQWLAGIAAQVREGQPEEYDIIAGEIEAGSVHEPIGDEA